jgi:hypothetical protein
MAHKRHICLTHESQIVKECANGYGCKGDRIQFFYEVDIQKTNFRASKCVMVLATNQLNPVKKCKWCCKVSRQILSGVHDSELVQAVRLSKWHWLLDCEMFCIGPPDSPMVFRRDSQCCHHNSALALFNLE